MQYVTVVILLNLILKGNIFLRTLDLSYNGLGKEGAVALEEALKHNNTLEDLNIRCCHSMIIYYTVTVFMENRTCITYESMFCRATLPILFCVYTVLDLLP